MPNEQPVGCLQYGCQPPQNVEIMNIFMFYVQNYVPFRSKNLDCIHQIQNDPCFFFFCSALERQSDTAKF